MAVSSNNMNLAQQIEEIGHKLAELPTEVDVLLPILDRVDVLLSQVDQSPIQELVDACSIVMKSLVKEPLLKHADNDVKVFIASCLCEVTRITAPESPYEDDEMKETFQLIVSSFKDLSDISSRSYSKRISILDNVARVRSSVVMLDLECDSLIVEMFHNFLGSIRDHHSASIFTYMESIMTLVIEESEDISLELLMPILDVVKKDNEDTQTISRKLGEKVLENCAVKVKPYLLQAVKSLGGPVSQYSAVVVCMCEESGVVEHHDDNGSINQLDKAVESLDEPAPVIPLNEPNALLDFDVAKDSKAEVESQKVNDDRDNASKDTLVDEDSHINTLASSENEKEVARVSSPKHFENEVVDIAAEIHPHKSLSTKENPIEGTPFVDPVSVEGGDVDDLQFEPRDCQKVNSNSTQEDEPMKEKMVEKNTPLGNETSTDVAISTDVAEVKVSSDDVAGRISDSEIKTQKSTVMDCTEDAPSNLGSLKDADRAFNLSVKRQKRSERKQMNLNQEDPKQEIVAKTDVKTAKGGKRINTDIPIDIKSDGTTSGDSETKPLIKEIAKRLSGKKRKGMTSDKPKAEIVKDEKEKSTSHQSPKKKKVSDNKAQQLNQSVKNGPSETDASEPEEKLIKYFKKGKKGNDVETSKGKENFDVKEDQESLKGMKRKAESVPDAELLKQSAKRKRKGEPKTDSLKQGAKQNRSSKKKQTNKTRGKSLPINAGSNEDNMTDLDVKDDCTEIISSPKSPELASKSVKDGERLEDSKIKSNRKQGKTKLDIEYGANLVDSKIKVWWQDDREFYEGVIASYDPDNKRHKVLYDDGEVEILNLKKETWEFVKDGTIENKQGDKESNEDVLAKTSRSKSVKSKKRGDKSPPDDGESTKPKSNSMSNRGKQKSASKSQSKTPQVGIKSDGKGRKRS